MSQLRNAIIANLGGSTPPGPINDGKLRFTIDTTLDPSTASDHLQYSFACGAANSVSDYVIDWGDGTTTTGTNSHMYASEGTYQITVSAGVSGNFPVCKLGSSGSGSYKKVVSVDTPPDTFYNYTGEVGGTSFFRYCTNLISVCSNFFVNNSQMTLLNSLFENTSSLETVPEGFFDNLVNVTQVPTMFKNSGIKYLPNGLFRFNTQIYNFNNCFNECKNLALNKNIFCDEATESTTRFISPYIDIPSFFRTFYRTSFVGDTSGVAPSLWNYSYNDNKNASDSSCFAGAGNSATSLSNYSLIPSAWGGPA